MKKSTLKLIASIVILSMVLFPSCHEDDITVVALDDISLSQTELLLGIDELSTIITTVSPETATENLIWSSDNEQIVVIQNSDNGLVAAVKGINSGDAILTASNQDGSISKSIQVKVIRRLESIRLAVEINETDLSQATVLVAFTPSNPTFGNLTWSSSNESVVTVDADGNLTAIAGSSAEGVLTETITATSDYNGLSSFVTVFVKGEPGSAVFVADYCSIDGNTEQHADYWINAITTSGAVQNLDFTDPVVSGLIYKYYEDDILIVNPGTEINFTMSYVNQWSVGEESSWVRSLVYIDWGADFDLTTEGELVAIIGAEDSSSNNITNSFTISVPASVVPGMVKLRFVNGDAYGATPDDLIPCLLDGPLYGVQDFDIIIQN